MCMFVKLYNKRWKSTPFLVAFICYSSFGLTCILCVYRFFSIREVKTRDRPWVSDNGVSDSVWLCIVLCYMKLSLWFIRNRAGDKDPVVFDEPILKEIAEKKKKSIAQVRFVVRVIFLSSQRWTMHNIIQSNNDTEYIN